MKAPLRFRTSKLSYEINWKIREIFSETALASFYDEKEFNYLAIEKTNKSIK